MAMTFLPYLQSAKKIRSFSNQMKMRTITVTLFLVITGWLAAQDSITLFDCHQSAVDNAPRLNDLEIIRQIGQLKLENTETSWLPSLNINGKFSYQSDVVTVTLTDPTIPVDFPEVPHDQYGLNLDISQTLYDGGITRMKKEFELASVAVDLQQVEVVLYGFKYVYVKVVIIMLDTALSRD